MTENPAELLRQAEERDLLAERFDGYAKNLGTLLGRIRIDSAAGGRIWTGPAAQRFVHDASRRSMDVDGLAERCREASRNLRRSASALRERAALSGKSL